MQICRIFILWSYTWKEIKKKLIQNFKKIQKISNIPHHFTLSRRKIFSINTTLALSSPIIPSIEIKQSIYNWFLRDNQQLFLRVQDSPYWFTGKRYVHWCMCVERYKLVEIRFTLFNEIPTSNRKSYLDNERKKEGVYPGCTVYNDDNEVGNMIYFASPFRPDVSFVRPPIALA